MLIYFLHDVERARIKIGRTRNPILQRQRSLEASTGIALVLLGIIDRDVERERHRRFKADRRKGEWFTLSPALATAIRAEFGYRIRAAAEHSLRAPKADARDLVDDIEARRDLGIRPQADHETIAGYLWQQFAARGCACAEEEPNADDDVDVQPDQHRCGRLPLVGIPVFTAPIASRNGGTSAATSQQPGAPAPPQPESNR
jgi:hypothetical protein